MKYEDLKEGMKVRLKDNLTGIDTFCIDYDDFEPFKNRDLTVDAFKKHSNGDISIGIKEDYDFNFCWNIEMFTIACENEMQKLKEKMLG